MRTSGIVLAACLCLGSLLAVDAFSSGSSLNFNKNVLSAKSSMTRTKRVGWSMMGKQAAFGPFSPIVILARSVVGEKQFNQIRGKGITLHSQVITEFCNYAGVPKDKRQGLIRLAKTNGNTLGFLS
ncbi:hypothetical protein GUITHDRAFT_161110 [Guillardia theta CCMP2712]|uniref:Uncharacterized protein n=2 Tax=Guillardia theta TaxID=55529 RepID=L1JX65_GUITC|nr:hypothetical protein GUITHDRAFT_161110 [Guillardia theta CCMP2712]EKX52924.1 hypothetical protein GUITHDRAFT_161110 [Guillardia theta CCMP2712]|mmetsp:Transcript_13091/g.46005  ORF Transcript_13091/g.46005 Transcript_13091/m.46005 type:complete len:126 (+) Transcript_13091:53-430(+)|eukprot:XP_005839904.1 hypothetical protein GUITHDRAFT_161110 [Guillardia theta CCMP2712]